jgi:hypothetical protein
MRMIKSRKLTLSLLMSNIYGAPGKARNFNGVYIYGLRFDNAESCLFLFAAQRFNIELMQKVFLCRSSQLCVNTLPATKITLITNGI